MTHEPNWALVIGGGIVTGLLILALITGLYLLLSTPPAAEPPERPAGMLAGHMEGMLQNNRLRLAHRALVIKPVGLPDGT